ncbi:MAG: hypothetical protein ACI4T9_13005 [Prevotella sp.]
MKIDEAILNAWTDGLTTDHQTKSGYNYKLVVTINKQQVQLSASLAPWTDVSATATGLINFKADVVTTDKQNEIDTEGSSFSLYTSTDDTEYTKSHLAECHPLHL